MRSTSHLPEVPHLDEEEEEVNQPPMRSSGAVRAFSHLPPLSQARPVVRRADPARQNQERGFGREPGYSPSQTPQWQMHAQPGLGHEAAEHDGSEGGEEPLHPPHGAPGAAGPGHDGEGPVRQTLELRPGFKPGVMKLPYMLHGKELDAHKFPDSTHGVPPAVRNLLMRGDERPETHTLPYPAPPQAPERIRRPDLEHLGAPDIDDLLERYGDKPEVHDFLRRTEESQSAQGAEHSGGGLFHGPVDAQTLHDFLQEQGHQPEIHNLLQRHGNKEEIHLLLHGEEGAQMDRGAEHDFPPHTQDWDTGTGGSLNDFPLHQVQLAAHKMPAEQEAPEQPQTSLFNTPRTPRAANEALRYHPGQSNIPSRAEPRRQPHPSDSKSPTRREMILGSLPGNVKVKPNPDAKSDAPWHEYPDVGRAAVIRHREDIAHAAQSKGIDPELIRAIMYMETSHGWYDPSGLGKPFSLLPILKSILPMNLNVSYWGSTFGSRDELSNGRNNVEAGAEMIRRLQKMAPGASIAEIATLYNNAGANTVSDYGARVAQLYKDKPWKLFTKPAPEKKPAR